MSINIITALPHHCLKGVTDNLSIEDLGRFGRVSRAARAYFQTSIAWVSHAEGVGLRPGQRRMEYIRAHLLKRKAREEIKKYRDTLFPYPHEASSILDQVESLEDMIRYKRIEKHHLYAKFIYAFAKEGLLKQEDLEELLRLKCISSIIITARGYFFYKGGFPDSMAKLEALGSFGSRLMNRPDPLERLTQSEIEKNKDLLTDDSSESMGRLIQYDGERLRILYPFITVPEELFGIKADSIEIAHRLESLPDFEKEYSVRSLIVNSYVMTDLRRSIRKLVGLENLSLYSTALKSLPPELLNLQSLKNLDLPFQLEEKLTGCEVLKELIKKGVEVEYDYVD